MNQKYAVIEDGVVANLLIAPEGFTDSDRQLVVCDDSVNRYDLFDGSTFTRPSPASTNPLMLAPFDFLNLFTAPERASIEASSDTTVKDAILQLDAIESTVDLSASQTKGMIAYMVMIGLLTSKRGQQILAGQSP